MQSLRFRPVASLMLCLHLAGCVTWQPLSEPRHLGTLLASDPPERIRVQRDGGDWIVITRPTVQGDSISGLFEVQRPSGGKTLMLGSMIALDDIRAASLGADSSVRSAYLALGVMGWGFVILVGYALSQAQY